MKANKLIALNIILFFSSSCTESTEEKCLYLTNARKESEYALIIDKTYKSGRVTEIKGIDLLYKNKSTVENQSFYYMHIVDLCSKGDTIIKIKGDEFVTIRKSTVDIKVNYDCHERIDVMPELEYFPKCIER